TPGSNSMATRSAFEKSKYSVVSCVFQNSLSSASRLNFGALLIFFFIKLPLLPAHRPGADDSDLSRSYGENDRQQPAAVGFSEGSISNLGICFLTATGKQRLVEEHLLRFPIRDAVLLLVLSGIPAIPLEPKQPAQFLRHALSI